MVLKISHTLGIISIIVMLSTPLFPTTDVKATPITSIESPQSIYLSIRQITLFQTNDFQTELLVKFYVAGFFTIRRTLCAIQPEMTVYQNGFYVAGVFFENVTGTSLGQCAWRGNENATSFIALSTGGFFSSLFTPFNVYSFNITLIGDPNISYRAESIVYLAVDFSTGHNYVLNSVFKNDTTLTGQSVFSYLITFSFPLEQKIGWIVNVIVYGGAFTGGIVALVSLLQRLKKRLKQADVERFLGVGY